jgi:hypothetical protein
MMAVRSVFLSLAVTLIAPSISRGQVERIHAYHSCKHRSESAAPFAGRNVQRS